MLRVKPQMRIKKTTGQATKTTGFAACVGAFLLFMPGMVMAQAAQSAGAFNTPYGKSYNDFNQPFDPRTRDANGNRTIVNGRFINGGASSLSFGLGGGFFGGSNAGDEGVGSAGAIGNQLNVVTTGSWNTVIVDSTQINNGNQTVNLSDQKQDQSSGQYSGKIETPKQDDYFSQTQAQGNLPGIASAGIANDGPYTTIGTQTTDQWQAAVPSELNGKIKLND